MQTEWTRRLLLAGLAGAPLAACATPDPARPVEVQVNLTHSALPPPPPGAEVGESDGAVRTGFDAVRRMTVQAMVNGSGPYRFVVDTGANRSVLSSEVTEALGLQASGRAMVHGIAGVLPSTTVMVEALTISGLVSRRVRMPVLPRRYLGADGLLGVDVLAKRCATLNFEGQSFSITTPVSIDRARLARGGASVAVTGPAPNEIVVKARHRFGQLTIVDAELGGVALTAFLDSGAEITVGNSALKREVLSRPGLVAGGLTRVELVSATGQLVDGELATVPPLRLGGVRLGNLACVFADLHTFKIWDLVDRPAMLIGVDVMRHFDSIELDFARSNVTFRSKLFGRSVNTGN